MESHNELSDFSKRLKEERIRQGYTQKSLSEESNIPIQTLRRYEQRKNDNQTSPLAENLVKIAQVLDITVEYLLFGKDQMDLYMNQLKKELKELTIADIYHYHKMDMTAKVLAHLSLTDGFIKEIREHWRKHGLNCYHTYVQDTIIRYCHHRPKRKK
jgi:transcriptional regulator with XRE-family HTH domain